MTELDIEKERREFEAWYEADALPAESDWFKKDDGGDYFHAATYSAWLAWLAAKRAVQGSAEPVTLPSPDMVRWDSNMSAPVHYYTISTVEKLLLLAAPPASDAKDSERFDWYFGPDSVKCMDFMAQYLKGMRERWSPDQWRAAIDAAIAAKDKT